jgi:putative membrane protein
MPPTPFPYCGPAPDPALLLGRWNLDPFLLAALGLLVIAYGWDMSRRARAHSSETLSFTCAWLTLFLLFVSPLCAWSSSLFSVRVAHHVVLITIAAPLLALARPVRQSRGGLTPILALHAAVLWMWHVPALYEAALANDAIFWAMQLSLLGTAILLWQRVLFSAGEAGRALIGLVGLSVQMGLLGALITFAAEPLYTPHFLTTAAWGLSPLEDQQLAGLIMWVPAILPYLAAGLWLSASLLNGAQAPAAKDRQWSQSG